MGDNYNVKWRFGVIDKLSGPAKRMAKSFQPMVRSAKRANIQFKLMQKSTAKLRGNLTKFGNGTAKVGRSMTTNLSAPIGLFGALTLRTALTFEKSMNKVEALTKATGKPLKDMRDMAKDLGATTQFSASQAAEAMSFLGMAGFQTNQILQATPALLDLAAASNTDLARSADIASNIMGAFGLKAKEMGRIADVLAATTAGANVDMEMMAEGMKDAAPVAKMYGLTLEETAGAMGLLGNIGIQGSKAGTTLKNMMLRLTAPGGKAKKMLKALGVQTHDSSGKMNKLTDIFKQMGPALSKLPKFKQLAVLNEVFGKRAIAGGGELLSRAMDIGQDGKNSIQRFTDSLEGSAGAAKKMAKTMNKGGPGAVKNLTSAFEGLQIAISESGLMDGFVFIVKKLTSMVRWMAKLNPTILKIGTAIATLVAVIGPLLWIFGKIIAMGGPIITGFNAIVVAVGFLWAKLGAFALLLKGVIVPAFVALKAIVIGIASALGVSVGLLAAFAVVLIATGVAIYKNWQPIKDFFYDLFTQPLQQMKDMIGFAGELARKAGSFFGFGSGESETDKKLREQGFKVQSGVSGDPVGAAKQTKKSNDFMLKQQKAQLGVTFANLPKGAKVKSEDPGSMLEIFAGNMGI